MVINDQQVAINVVGNFVSPGSPEDEMEVEQIMLYCECLMGISLVSVKLAHTQYQKHNGRQIVRYGA